MASKGPRSKLDHETRAKRHKALEAPREPPRPKAHWDHVLEEMVWLSKDFESERKWKLAQAKKVALRASKGMLDQATRGERKMKEEEQRLRKVALNISKDVKKFWIKIEKLVLYKHQMELDEKKKKALDKQLEFLLGQTERYSTMLAENLVDSYKPVQQHPVQDRLTIGYKEDGNNSENLIDVNGEPWSETAVQQYPVQERPSIQCKEEDGKNSENLIDVNGELQSETANIDEDYDVQFEDESEDDEHTIEEDEALITKEERQEELEALQNETDLPLEELLKRYTVQRVNRESSPEKGDDGADSTLMEDHGEGNGNDSSAVNAFDTSNLLVRRCGESNGDLSTSDNHLFETEKSQSRKNPNVSGDSPKEHGPYDFNEELEDGDFVLATGEEKDDETTLSEEEDLAKVDLNNPIDEIALLQKESEIPLEELLTRYKKDINNNEVSEDGSDYASASSEDLLDSTGHEDTDLKLDNCTVSHVEPSEGQPFVHPLTKDQEAEPEKMSEGRESEYIIADAAAAARSAQPTGNTFSTTKVRTKFPFLLKYPLREYQHIGLDWLVTMYEKRLNGILADEMGLGKTIMTIALLAHLACEKGIWGPHLIVVPTSVMLNWETEFLKWCPAFKILTYFGSAKERKCKRQGWLKPNFFHVCITTYRLVIQDSKVFKRKKWKYLILDEAHLIKNWKSQRWQTLLNFNSKRRILLTGTPLQNDLMELWSLMHFLMPHIFQSHQEFKDWFSNPIAGMVEGQEKVNKEVLDRLHNVLRPFILRRLKKDVEKQLPLKHEHVIFCRLSRRQRNLYEDFIASSETQATLASGNFFGMISIIMQLRKVCNHPDLFEGRPIISSFDMGGIDIQLSSSVCSLLSSDPFSTVDLQDFGFLFTHLDFSMTSWESDEVKAIATPSSLIEERAKLESLEEFGPFPKDRRKLTGTNIFEEIRKAILQERVREAKQRAASIAWWNSLRCRKKPIYSRTLRNLVTVKHPVDDALCQKTDCLSYSYSSKLADIVLSPVERLQKMTNLVESFMFAIPAARAPAPVCWCSKTRASVFLLPTYKEKCSEILLPLLSPIRPAIVRRQVYFPDRRLIQFDCGKLQELAILLRKLKSEGHRALIFTQMTKMLDILEAFINLYGYTYMRLDGSTQPEERQTLMQRFNTNPKIFLFILSTRSGGVGINLVGADTVIFYDSDWNPAMDQQAQDRCHRIGQTREVHIYRLISDSTIEENILKKANQKRALDDLVIQSGGYNTEFFKKLDPIDLFSGHQTFPVKNIQKEKTYCSGVEVSVSNADVEAALKHVEDEADYMALKKVEQEEAVENQEFTEEAIGRLEDDELVNEEDMKADESVDQTGWLVTANRDSGVMINGSDPNDERALTFAGKEDDVDMLADVKQMAAAAAAAGQAISSFENQLRPIDRYAIRFLELWDPIIDKAATESEVRFEERDWELDCIEKYKEEMEAEIDDDEEPLVYERWDADLATEAYRQQVEALAQHQLMEDLEAEAKEKEDAEENFDSMKNQVASDFKPKSKKKPKKAKFKSLKKGSLTSDLKSGKKESTVEPMSTDDDNSYDEDVSSDTLSLSTNMQKKRKRAEFTLKAEEVKSSRKKPNKTKKSLPELCPLDLASSLSGKRHDHSRELQPCDNMVFDVEQKPARSKIGGKISITSMPVKRILMIKPEKLKKGNVWSRECVPSPDFWLPQEDAILCAVVHEYGPHWSLVSETLYGMTAGGFYRGRYRHPVHCCERFRELIQRYILSAPDISINEKISNTGSGKALLKVTEDNIRMLLNVAAEQPDNELLLQKHFTALLSSVWRSRSRNDRCQDLSSTRNGLSFGGKSLNSVHHPSRKFMKEPAQRMEFTNLGQSWKLLEVALRDANSKQQGDKDSFSESSEDIGFSAEQLDLTLEFPMEKDDSMIPMPPIINLSIYGSDPPTFMNKAIGEEHLKASQFQYLAENRFRAAARECVEDSLGWALSAFPASDVKSRPASKAQSLGKHKLSSSDLIKPPKLKFKRTSIEHNEIGHLLTDTLLQPMPTVSPKDPNLRFDLTPDIIQNGWMDELDRNSPYGIDEDLSLNTETSEAVLLHYDPGLLSDLDDFSQLPDFTDIG
ncbi:SNF2_N domain-containing protein/Helicase_C domain-containing protein/HSA domain-containing protein [Cephalotus follicularis]|uniref:DNA helicase n=1 Tax=Cephalotus follicularis TaxID=3775 RepID=A0A1Q3B7P2_CEPFO|nr:SNF2_N domain-containing protein/Helicase_C domain-containing protein/HSA domain-containing protein [Cephalotus follicularis]